MSCIVVYDTETTGLALFDQPSDHADQPHIVQIGARLVDLDSRRIVSTLDVIVKPSGWTISEDVARIHGITHERALAVGVSEALAVEMLLELAAGRTRVAHNQGFDQRIIRIACKRFFDSASAEEWQTGTAECTAVMATPIMRLPPTERMLAAGRNHPKTPNLGEAYRFFTGRRLEGAHSALVDVDACMECYFAMLDGVREAVAA